MNEEIEEVERAKDNTSAMRSRMSIRGDSDEDEDDDDDEPSGRRRGGRGGVSYEEFTV